MMHYTQHSPAPESAVKTKLTHQISSAVTICPTVQFILIWENS